MGVIAEKVEDYISFSIKVEVDKYIDKEGNERSKEIELRFIDSFKFMSSSLDSLVNNLAKGDHKFLGFEEYSDRLCELLIRKGIYPYEYMNKWDRFNETKLLNKESFYSNLNMSGVSDKEHSFHAWNVWNEFKIRNMGEYHDLYLKRDVILVANVFESSMSVCMKNYGLDPAHFYTAPKMKINSVEKLIPNLHYKRKYIIHVRALKQALDHGLVLEHIHRCTRFKQSPWMKEYIDFNTRLRTAAKNDFEKDFYKLMNSSVFGKTMENIHCHRNIKLVNNKEEYLQTVMKPSFKSGTLLGPDLMGCEMGKIKVVMNKPVYLGQAILDLSKIIMYEFHYDYIKYKV